MSNRSDLCGVALNSYKILYDNSGNITSVKTYERDTSSGVYSQLSSTKTYSYEDDNWKDKLTSYNGDSITYDENGNPLSYRDNISFTWENGRNLSTVALSSNAVYNMKYDIHGLRTQKTSGTRKTYYYYDTNNKLIAMNVKGNGVGNIVVYYYYDNDGNVVSMSKNGTIYHYLKNLQGDIFGINDSANNTVVSYSYDMFGKTTTVSDTSSQNLSTLNPFRFRGYIFDHETGFYYLNSRYYDPETGRFINADIYCDTGTNIFGTNMYAYSNNNYVNQVDPEGTDAYWVQFGFGAKGFGHTSVLLQDTVNNWWYFYWSGKQVILRNCGKDRFENHSELNCYLCGFDPRNHHCHYVFANNVVHDSEEVQNIYGEKYRLKAHDKQITDWILFMGDFSNSYTYLQNLCNKLFFNSNATQLFTYVREKNKDVLMYQVVSEAYDKPFYAWLLGLNFYCKYYKDIKDIKVNNNEVKQYDLFNNNCLHVSLDALLNGSFIYSNERDILKDIRKDEFIPNKAYNKLFEKTFI